MAIRSILVPLSGRFAADDPQSLDRAALDAALRTGRRLGGHVTALCPTLPANEPEKALAAWVPSYGVEQLISIVEKGEKVRAKRARQSFEAAVAAMKVEKQPDENDAAGVDVSYVEEVGDIRQSVMNYGRVTDLLVVASTPERWRSHFRPILDTALRDTGRPLLIAPLQASVDRPTRALIAWNGSMEAARALSAAVDFLPPRCEVDVVAVVEDEIAGPTAEQAAGYLERHGVASQFRSLQGGRRESSELIISHAKARQCDLLIMGACIHNRAHRVLFGSVTEAVLSQTEFPTLMVP